MSAFNDKGREDQALEALIAVALRHDGGDDLTWEELQRDEAFLTEEDQRALEVLPSDLTSRLLAGERIAGGSGADATTNVVDEELLAAMNRGGDDSGITDKAREEMERRIREAEAQETNQQDEEGGNGGPKRT